MQTDHAQHIQPLYFNDMKSHECIDVFNLTVLISRTGIRNRLIDTAQQELYARWV